MSPNGSTCRQEVKELLVQLEQRYPNLRQKISVPCSGIPVWVESGGDGEVGTGIKKGKYGLPRARGTRNDTLQGVQYRRVG